MNRNKKESKLKAGATTGSRSPTPVIAEGDDLDALLTQLVLPELKTGDLVFISEKMVAAPRAGRFRCRRLCRGAWRGAQPVCDEDAARHRIGDAGNNAGGHRGMRCDPDSVRGTGGGAGPTVRSERLVLSGGGEKRRRQSTDRAAIPCRPTIITSCWALPIRRPLPALRPSGYIIRPQSSTPTITALRFWGCGPRPCPDAGWPPHCGIIRWGRAASERRLGFCARLAKGKLKSARSWTR